MPRKVKNVDAVETKKSKKTLLSTIVKNVNSKDEHIILQLPLTQHQIDKIVCVDKCSEYTNDPIPYERNCCFLTDDKKHEDNEIIHNKESGIEKVDQCCFWCCHSIDYKVYGMPINYDSITDTYTIYGSFCSLQCANAHNFSVYNGSDKVWEINSMIQMMGKRYGFVDAIRPAPSKYLLKMFGGNITIEEFRKMHQNNESSHVLNLPPMISIPSAYEAVNTSYIKKGSE
jgi:hypothetical protein